MTDPKITLGNFIEKLPKIGAVAAAAVLAMSGVHGWGWFLLVAVLV
jgi:hypothetical protein